VSGVTTSSSASFLRRSDVGTVLLSERTESAGDFVMLPDVSAVTVETARGTQVACQSVRECRKSTEDAVDG
jgi:hypothetical protein